MRLDLNADVGERALADSHDAAIMRAVSSVSIAAGGHAGDARTIRAAVRLAREHGVAVGAHPGFVDREGFGRRELRVETFELERQILEQIVAVASAAADEGLELQHVKPHGALYNMAAKDVALAAAVVGAVALFDSALALFAPPDSALSAAGRRGGLKVVTEGFADRAYAPDGTLVPRGVTGAVIDDRSQVVDRAVRMALDRRVQAIDGSLLALEIDTLCLHGDTDGADALAMAVRKALDAARVSVRPPGRRQG
jgi:5-oxoprolinase (ATP-hydrolysing) subunit A